MRRTDHKSCTKVTFGFIRQEVIDFGRCTIIGNDVETFVIHIKNEVLAL